MAVKRYDGSAWQTVAGLGAQGAAATSSSIATWVKTASGGETSLSGNDDNSQALSYTIGQELVFINGTLLKRGSDYTATNGTSITGLTALAANDVATVWTVNAFSVTGAIANTIVDAKGDLLVGTAADTPGRLAVGTNDYVLTADSTTGTGLKWAAPAAGGKVLQVVSSSSNTSTTVSNQTYTDTTLSVTITPTSTTSTIAIFIQQMARISAGAKEAGLGFRLLRDSTTIFTPSPGHLEQQYIDVGNATAIRLDLVLPMIYRDSPATTSATTYKTQGRNTYSGGSAVFQGASSISFIIAMEIGA